MNPATDSSLHRNNEPQTNNSAVFAHKITVDESAIDGLQHVNNGCYVTWCETAAWAHSAHLGLELADYLRLNRAMAVRHAEYDYVCASYLGDTLLISTWLSDFTSVQMKRSFQVTREHDGATILQANWQLACIELSTGKAKRLPKEFSTVYGVAADK